MATDLMIDQDAQQFVRRNHAMLIGEDWVEAASERRLDVVDPSTGETLTSVPRGDSVDVDRAVSTARAAFETGPWASMSPSDRGRAIHRLGDLILEHGDELAALDALDVGKSFVIARAIDVAAAADMFHYMSGWATKITGATIQPSVPFLPDAEFHCYTLREPIGVVGQIIPWNFPLLMASWKLAPALATGCTIVLKPAEQTPLSALRLGELILDAGIPAGVVNIVTGLGEEAGAALASHPRIDKIAFTGSTEVGKQIVKAATGNLKKVSLELGGKNPNVVFGDADLEQAIPGAANAIFFNHGQACAAGSRLFVESKAYDDVLAGVADIAGKMQLGSGFDPAAEMGPLISEEQLSRVCGLIESGQEDGAETVVGGKRTGEGGYFVEPTVMANTNPGMRVESEEIFGPVVTVTPFKDAEELIPWANGTDYGLASGVWTNDLSKAHRTAKLLEAGTVWINCYAVVDPALPYGGYKQSGWGREMGAEVLDLYTQVKTVIAQL